MKGLLIAARDAGHKPRVHGNGFVQLDLVGGTRLHLFGHPEVPHQESYTGIHDHRFSFESKILCGVLTNQVYAMGSGPPTHHVYSPEPAKGPFAKCRARDAYPSPLDCTYPDCQCERVPTEDTDLIPTGEDVHLFKMVPQMYRPGQCYFFPWRELHETIADIPTVTIINKTEKHPDYDVRVMVPYGEKPDNNFKREAVLDEASLWRILFDTAQGVPSA
jgi:hypothetical protein